MRRKRDQQSSWVLPLRHHELTGTFGATSSLWSQTHTGLDFAAPDGTPIRAVAAGTVTEPSWAGSYGYRTITRLPDGTEIWYCHQSRLGVSVGATMEVGDVIGYVGATGNVTGSHLHIEVRTPSGTPTDPYAALVSHGLQP